MRRALPRLLGALAGAAVLGLLAYDAVLYLVREPPIWLMNAFRWGPEAPLWVEPYPLPEPIRAEPFGWLVFGLALPALLLTPVPRGRIPYWGEWLAAAGTVAGFTLLLLTLPWSPEWAMGHGDLAGLRILWVAMIGAYPATLMLHDAGRIEPTRARWVRAVLWASVVMVVYVYFEAVGAMHRTGKPMDPFTFHTFLDAVRYVALVLAFRYIGARPTEFTEAAPAPEAEPGESRQAVASHEG